MKRGIFPKDGRRKEGNEREMDRMETDKKIKLGAKNETNDRDEGWTQ